MRYFTEELRNAILEGNKEAVSSLKKIDKGIYIHVFQPKKDVYEARKNRNHVIKSGTIVIKPGKFVSGLFGRARGYTKCWKYESTNELCFFYEVKSYLLVDLSPFKNDYVARIEAGLTSAIHHTIGETFSYEKGSHSEYRIVKEGIQITDEMINKLSEVIRLQIEHDMSLNINVELYTTNAIVQNKSL